MKRIFTAAQLRLVLGLVVAPLLAGTYSNSADACGCFAPPLPQPGEVEFAVNQQSEQIIFEVDGDYINAHVLIRYAGAPESFGWLVPVPNEPDIQLSTSGAFGLLDQQTAPVASARYQSVCPTAVYYCQEQYPNCPSNANEGVAMNAGSFTSPSAGAGGAASSADAGAAPPTVMVYSQKQIGAYNTVTLGSNDAGAIVAWLNANDFITNETMTPYMQPYLDAGMLFVAAKLVPGAGVEEIRPLRMRYKGTEPSIPLRLTAVAAEPHLTVTAYIYANEEYQPIDHPVATMTDDRIGYGKNNRLNYPMALSRLVDEEGGDAFVREYSGPPPRYQDQGQGCCTHTAPLSSDSTDGDAGVDDNFAYDFCGIGNDSQCQCPFDSFDQSDCADAEGVTEAITLVSELANKYTHLTRLTTRISPEEMTFDPAFEGNSNVNGDGRLIVNGTHFNVGACTQRVIDVDLLEQQQALEACASVYCGSGECAAVDGDVGCICDDGFVARTFTDLDGQSSVTCVPAKSSVDLSAGGLDIPDVCEPLGDVANGKCVDVANFAAVLCNDGFAAVDDGSGIPLCSKVTSTSDTAGAGNNTAALKELDICQPVPPACSAFGWLKKFDQVQLPGVECEDSIPDPSWLEQPAPPTCADTAAMVMTTGDTAPATNTAGMSSVAVSAFSGMDTTAARPAVVLPASMNSDSTSPSEQTGNDGSSVAEAQSTGGGCSVGNPGSRGGLQLALLGLAAAALRRRRRARA